MGVDETKCVSKTAVVVIVYLAFVLDNMLLTVVGKFITMYVT